ncbi:MAG: prolyl-tRNA synthetase associated domain-containing protein [Arenicellales bacterium]|jgi:Ala-tRNA(Pro) deacylase
MEDNKIPLRLADGSAPMTAEALLDQLRLLGISVPTIEHPPMVTVKDSKAMRVTPVGAGDIKNLFVRNKKGQMWLITCQEDRQIDLKALAKALGAGRFSFASHQRLMLYLGVAPGAVSPLALINDRQRSVTFVIDNALLACETIYLHPLDNTRTSTMTTCDLLDFIAQTGHPAYTITFDTDGVHCGDPLSEEAR